MAKQGISTGTTPNDGSGDSLLSGAVKINSNFDELYSAIGDGSSLSTPVTSVTAGDNITVTASTGNITISGIGTGDIDTDRINVSGVVTASSFSGSGVNLTNLPSSALVGALPALDGSALTGVVAAGTGVTVQDGGSGKGTASILNFGSNLSVTTTNSGITTISAGAANTANLNSDTIVVGVLTATTFAGDLTLSNGDLNLPSTGGINATTSTENLHWGQGNFYFNAGTPEIGWIPGNGSVAVGAGNATEGYTFKIQAKNSREDMAVFTGGGSAALYYNDVKKFETTGSGTTTYGTALTQQLNVTGVSTFSDDITLTGASANIVFDKSDNALEFAENAKATFGNAADLKIYHNGSASIIEDPGAGTLKVRAYQIDFEDGNGSDVHAKFNGDGSKEFYYDGSKKFETTGSGTTTYGTALTQQLNVTGVSTFEGNTNLNNVYLGDNNVLNFGASNDLQLYHSSSGDVGAFVQSTNQDLHLVGPTNGGVRIINYNKDSVVANYSGSVDLYYDGSKKFETTGVGVSITGNVYATGISTFIGNVIIGRTANEGSGMLLNGGGDSGGSINFTGPNSSDVNESYYPNIRLVKDFGYFKGDLEFHTNGYTGIGNGVGDFIFYKRHTSYGRAERMRLEGETGNLTLSGTSSGGICSATSFYGDGSDLVDGKWTLGANGSSDYTFTGIGFTQTTNDPILYLARGRVYEFVNTMGSHPFEIRESAGGSAFDRGVTNNGTQNGTVRFEIPFDAPNTLYYQCTAHSGMGSTIVVYPNTI